MKSKTLTIRITESQYEKLISHQSISEELTISSVIRNLINESENICRRGSTKIKSLNPPKK